MRAQDHDGVRLRQLETERSAKRAEREHMAAAHARACIDDNKAEVFPKRWVLKAVIHDDEVHA